jgi:phage terminase large subunit-like protein
LITDGFSSILQKYIDDVLESRIVVSKAVRAAVERHVRDLQKQSTSEFPFHYNQSAASRVCSFFPLALKHSIGRYEGMPFELEPWQVFCVSMIFGWQRDCDQTRRFRKAYRTMARKNGKSTWIAGESLYMAGFDYNPIRGKVEPVSQVVLSATKKEQVDEVVFAEALRMRLNSKALSHRTEHVNRRIKFAKNDGTIITVGSDRPYDGLNPHNVNMDELHEWREHHRKFYDTMVTGSGFRDQPLISMITTAGDDRSYLWQEIHKYGTSVATGLVEDDSYFAFIAELDEQDDPLDESVWLKANPNLGVSVTWDYLREQAREAKQSAVSLNRFTRYHCNRLVSALEKPFDLEQWDGCKGELSNWQDADAIGAGVDLGGRDDLAAYALVARFPVGEDADGNPLWRFEAKVRCYIAEDTERDLTVQPFAGWKYSDLLRVCRFPTNDLFRSLVEECGDLGISDVAYDPYNGQKISEDLQAEGIKAYRMAQNQIMFNEPIHDLMCAIREGRFKHDGNPLLRWCVNNAQIARDRNDRWMYDKRSSAEKIDAIVALTMAFRVATLAKPRATGKLFIS